MLNYVSLDSFESSAQWILPWRSSIGLSRVLSASEPTSVHISMDKLGLIQHLSVNNRMACPCMDRYLVLARAWVI